MRINASLGRKVAFGIALSVMLVVTTHSVAIFVVTDEEEEELIDQIISDELEYMVDSFKRNPGHLPLRAKYLYGYITRIPDDLDRLPPFLRELRDGVQEIFVNGQELHVGVRTLEGARFDIVYDVKKHEERMAQFKYLLIWGVIVTGLLAIGLGLWLSGVLLKPIGDLAQRVGVLESGRQPARLAPLYAEEEVRSLAHAFDQYAQRIAEALEREQEFTANVSHELRTPLTSIRTSCELLAQDARLAPDARARLDRIGRAVERMAVLIQSLLYLARSGQVAEAEEFALIECVQEAIDALPDMSNAKSVKIEIDIGAGAVLRLARDALMVVLTNLIKNAMENTDRGRVMVQYRSGVLSVEDTGCGIRNEHLPRVLERFYRVTGGSARPDGFGLGLAIVKRVCDQYGWSPEIRSQIGVGTRVSITFPAGSESSHPLHT